jgi:hypothetical protein
MVEAILALTNKAIGRGTPDSPLRSSALRVPKPAEGEDIPSDYFIPPREKGDAKGMSGFLDAI